MHTQSFAKNNHNAAVDDFFVPELCQPEALLSMVLLAELLTEAAAATAISHPYVVRI